MDEEDNTPYVLENMLRDTSAEPTDLPLSLFREITKQFSHKHEIGSGGFGVVYKVRLIFNRLTLLSLSNLSSGGSRTHTCGINPLKS